MSPPRIVIPPTLIDDDGQPYTVSTMSPVEENIEKIVLLKPCIIPVLFLPGIMGTNLRNKTDGSKAWRPPNTDLVGLPNAFLQLIVYAFTSAEERADTLAMDRVEVDPSGPIDAGRSGLPKNVLKARGWGALMRSSYHPFMANLEFYLNNLALYDFERNEVDFKEWAHETGAESPTDWGSETGEPLTREEILHAARYKFDVWAGGYNWIQSNRDSGQQIKDFIENQMLPFYNQGRTIRVTGTPDGKGKDEATMVRRRPSRVVAEKVIIVTHSMGGLVSRALTEIHGCDKVLGVSHGVQPATGAPAAYKRMRAGFEGKEQIILGSNAAEVTAVSAQSPGALELLPTADYNDGKPWLFVRERKVGQGAQHPPVLALPQHGDPYSEIYQTSAWYGLVNEHNEGMLSLGKKRIASDASSISTEQKAQSPRRELSDRIVDVKAFHNSIERRYMNRTYVHYGAQAERDKKLNRGGVFDTGFMAAMDRFAWGEVAWEALDVGVVNPDSVAIAVDDGNGKLRTTDGIWMRIAPPQSPGDGTVPLESAAAPIGCPGVVMSFAHGHKNPGTRNAMFGYDHQDSYNDERALFATLYAIIKIAQQADWYPSNEEK